MKLAVLGDPVSHSQSPRLHRGFLDAAHVAGTYEAIRVEAGTLALRLAELRAAGFDGLNVTTPLKEEAFALCAETDSVAAFARAANTLWFAGDRVVGANTDGDGAIAAVAGALARTPSVTGRMPPAAETSVQGRLVLVIGTGPTARAAAFALANAGARLALWSRRAAPLTALASGLALGSDGAEIFVLDGRRARTIGIDSAPWPGPGALDAVFSTAPPSATFPAALTSLLSSVPCVIDANYGPRATLARILGRDDVEDGTVMLAAQARASFALWHGRR